MGNDELIHNSVCERDGTIHLYIDIDIAKMRDGYVRYHEGRVVAAICKSAEHLDQGAEFAFIKMEIANIDLVVETTYGLLMDIVKQTKDLSNEAANKMLVCALLHTLAEKPAHFNRFMQVFAEMQHKKGRRSAQFEMRSALGMDED